MTTAMPHAQIPHTAPMGWFARTEAWMDEKGKGAWIAAMVLGFVFFWPVGLALLFYMIWSNRMSGKFYHNTALRRGCGRSRHTMTSTGNSAFDAYKADTLTRLEREQQDFEAFLARLRDAKDKAEFDQFMDERATAARYEEEDERPA